MIGSLTVLDLKGGIPGVKSKRTVRLPFISGVLCMPFGRENIHQAAFKYLYLIWLRCMHINLPVAHIVCLPHGIVDPGALSLEGVFAAGPGLGPAHLANGAGGATGRGAL